MRHHRLPFEVVVSCPLSEVLGKCQRRWLIVPRPSRGRPAVPLQVPPVVPGVCVDRSEVVGGSEVWTIRNYFLYFPRFC